MADRDHIEKVDKHLDALSDVLVRLDETENLKRLIRKMKNRIGLIPQGLLSPLGLLNLKGISSRILLCHPFASIPDPRGNYAELLLLPRSLM